MRTLVKEIIDQEGEVKTFIGRVSGRRDHGKIIFIDLVDRSGVVQTVFSSKDEDLYEEAVKVRDGWIIEIEAEIKKRPEKMVNPEIETGGYELSAKNIKVISASETPPISFDGDGYEISEEHRMKYRYIDLRRDRMKKNLKLRYKTLKFFRDYLGNKEFIEVETPILGKSTPEGARDYLVPSRKEPGSFYALPQSPQQYKQLLMISGMERYFQVVKCFRDEDTRGDRQPEFTQLDIEMSYIDQEEVLDLVESMLLSLFKDLYPEKIITLDEQGRIPRMSFQKAMDDHGTDRPDVRKDKTDENELAPLIVTDFPAFEYKEGDKRWGAVHHPFTMPKVDNEDDLRNKFSDDPSKISSYQYDLVLNGFEIAGGSIRTHDPKILSTTFELLGHTKEEVEDKFGHLLEAFKYGVPPHGGIAFGLDRLLAILLNEPNIREVIAFPKTGDGRDLMMSAPSNVSDEQLRELHIKIDKKIKK